MNRKYVSAAILLVLLVLFALHQKISVQATDVQQECNGHPSSLAVGMTAQVTGLSRLYPQASHDNMIIKLDSGTIVSIIGGPICERDLWWQVSDGTNTGWLVEVGYHGPRWLEPTTATAPVVPPTQGQEGNPPAQNNQPPAQVGVAQSCNSFETYLFVGATAVTSGSPRLYPQARSDSMIRRLSSGTNLSIISGPICDWSHGTAGNLWWQVSDGSDTGWIVEVNYHGVRYLELSGGTNTGGAPQVPAQPQPTAVPTRQPSSSGSSGSGSGSSTTNSCRSAKGLVVGDIVIISDETSAPARVRSGPSTNDPIITNIPIRTLVSLIGGPSCGSGYVWWETQYDNKTGWTAEINLIRNGDPLPGGTGNNNSGGSAGEGQSNPSNPPEAVVTESTYVNVQQKASGQGHTWLRNDDWSSSLYYRTVTTYDQNSANSNYRIRTITVDYYTEPHVIDVFCIVHASVILRDQNGNVLLEAKKSSVEFTGIENDQMRFDQVIFTEVGASAQISTQFIWRCGGSQEAVDQLKEDYDSGRINSPEYHQSRLTSGFRLNQENLAIP